MRHHPWILMFILCACAAQTQVLAPVAQKRLNATLLASDGQAHAGFGYPLAVGGNVIAVANGLTPGPVYLYSRLSKETVNQIGKLIASDGTPLQGGLAVAQNGKFIVAGAETETVGKNSNQGAVYVFAEPEAGWVGNISEVAKLIASDGGANSLLGISVSINNGVVVAGASGGGNQGQGEAYVFVEPQGGWVSCTETARLNASNGQNGDHFGVSVAVYGPRIVVGADGFNSTEGEAYVFQESVGGWKTKTETAQLSHPGPREFFGASVAVWEKTVVIGSPFATGTGAAYIFVQPASGWVNNDTPDATLTEAGSGCFGNPVSIRDAMIAVGDYCVRYGGGKIVGDSVVYLASKNGWQNSSDGIVLRPKGSLQSSFVAVGKERVIVGSPWTTVGNNVEQGAAFLYSIPTN